MEISEACNLINLPNLRSPQPQIWADLGCGSGIFTMAPAQLLEPESMIYAVDTNKTRLMQIPDTYQNVNIKKINADFVRDNFELPESDGILTANSLHFVADKKEFLKRIMQKTDKLVIVEYDTNIANRRVPYPVPFTSLKSLFTDHQVFKIGERSSIYNGGKMYSALISR